MERDRKKRLDLWKNDRVFHQENALARSEISTQRFLTDKKILYFNTPFIRQTSILVTSAVRKN